MIRSIHFVKASDSLTLDPVSFPWEADPLSLCRACCHGIEAIKLPARVIIMYYMTTSLHVTKRIGSHIWTFA